MSDPVIDPAAAAAPTPAPASRQPAQPKAAPKWETDTKERIRAMIRKYQKALTALVERDANEGDTRLFITDFLEHALGYDKYVNLTTEFLVQGEFADYGIRIDQQLIAFVEVKRATTKLGTKHLRQVQTYAANKGVSWVILTNGQDWEAYHISDRTPIAADLVFAVNLLGPETGAQKATTLFLLSLEAMKRDPAVIQECWDRKAATSPKVLASALLSEAIITALRRKLKSASGFNVDDEELQRLVRETVIRPEAL